MNTPICSLLFCTVVAALVTITGCNSSTKKKDYDTHIARFLVEANEGDEFATVTLPVSEVKITVNNKPMITEFDFTGVQLAKSDMGAFFVFMLTPDASRDVYRVSTTNQGKRLVLFIDGVPVGARMIDRPFNTGAISIYPALPNEDLEKLVKNLNATSLDFQKRIAKASQ